MPYNETMSGGVLVGGESANTMAMQNVASGGVLDGGSSTDNLFMYNLASGGTTAGGSAVVSIGYLSSGGASLGGTAGVTISFKASGGAVLSGSALVSTGVAASGGVSCGGTANFTVAFDQQYVYNINGYLTVDQAFRFNIGRSPLRYYRVQGCCVYPTSAGSGDPLHPFPGGCEVVGIQTDDENCVGTLGKTQYFRNIIARDVTEVCEKLTRSKIRWQICSLKRWSRPADPRLSPEEDECNVLEDVPFAEIPECLEFTLASDSITNIKATVGVLECRPNDPNGYCNLYAYEGSGSLSASGDATAEITAGGSTPTVWSYSFVSAGGLLVVGGSGASSSFQTDYLTVAVVRVTLPVEEPVFTTTDDLPELPKFTDSIVTGCATCNAIPINLYLTHNLTIPGLFYNFLQRNNLQIPQAIQMTYSATQLAWVATLQYKGITESDSTLDNWRLVFEFACTDNISGEYLGSPVIKFSMTVNKKNLTTNKSAETKYLITLPPVGFCASVNNFRNTFNWQLNLPTQLVRNSANLTVQSLIYYDKIGMFSSKQWMMYPNLIFTILKDPVQPANGSYDLTPIIPQKTPVLGREIENILGLPPSPYIIDRPKRIYVQPPIVTPETAVPGIRQTGSALPLPILTET